MSLSKSNEISKQKEKWLEENVKFIPKENWIILTKEKGEYNSENIVEFSGTPEAGKTTSIRTIANMLRNDGYKFYKEGMCKKEEYDEYKNTFVERLKPDLLIGLIVSTQIAVKRRGGEGHLVNC